MTGPHRRREEAAGGALCVSGQPWGRSEQQQFKSQGQFRAKRELWQESDRYQKVRGAEVQIWNESFYMFGITGDTRWRKWLRHCATSRKVAGSIRNDVVGIFR